MRVRYSRRTGGPHGGTVRLGDTMVPRRAEMRLEAENGEPDMHAVFEVRDGRPECISFSVTGKGNGRGIRTADLQVFNIDALATLAFARHAEPIDTPSVPLPLSTEQQRVAYRDVYEARKARRGGITRAELERVAEVYRQHVDSSPTKAVGVLLGYEGRTAARRVQQAREAGLLPATTPGKRKA